MVTNEKRKRNAQAKTKSLVLKKLAFPEAVKIPPTGEAFSSELSVNILDKVVHAKELSSSQMK